MKASTIVVLSLNVGRWQVFHERGDHFLLFDLDIGREWKRLSRSILRVATHCASPLSIMWQLGNLSTPGLSIMSRAEGFGPSCRGAFVG